MHRPPMMWSFFVLFVPSILAMNMNLDCSKSGCIQDLREKIPTIEIAKYKNQLRKTFSAAKIESYKIQAVSS